MIPDHIEDLSGMTSVSVPWLLEGDLEFGICEKKIVCQRDFSRRIDRNIYILTKYINMVFFCEIGLCVSPENSVCFIISLFVALRLSISLHAKLVARKNTAYWIFLFWSWTMLQLNKKSGDVGK